jgi:predicted Zn-dependent protease
VRPLPEGEYLVALARDVAIGALHEEILDALEAGAVRVTLVDGKDTIQDLLARTGR